MITREQARKIFAERGIKPCAPDDPIYKEGPTITFVKRKPAEDEHTNSGQTPSRSFTAEDIKEEMYRMAVRGIEFQATGVLPPDKKKS